jgi:hypothetical protein
VCIPVVIPSSKFTLECVAHKSNKMVRSDGFLFLKLVCVGKRSNSISDSQYGEVHDAK